MATPSTSTSAAVNMDDMVAFVHACSANVSDMQGLLLVDAALLHTNTTDVALSQTECTTPHTTTVNAKLIGNLLFFWDCTLDSQSLQQNPALTKCLILERVVLELLEADAQYPYGLKLTCTSNSPPDMFLLSAFSESDREQWMRVLSECSCELSSQLLYSAHSSEQHSPEHATQSHAPNMLKTEAATLLLNWDHSSLDFSLLSSERGVHCEEWLAESKLCLTVPPLLLVMFKAETQTVLDALAEHLAVSTTMSSELIAAKHEHVRLMLTNMAHYDTALNFLQRYDGSSFRPSIEKTSIAWSFCPINLHFQSFNVLVAPDPDVASHFERFDFWTAGTCSAMALKYLEGGASKQMYKLYGHTKSVVLSEPIKVQRLMSGLHSINTQLTALLASCNKHKHTETQSLVSAASRLHHLYNELLLLCEPVQSALTASFNQSSATDNFGDVQCELEAQLLSLQSKLAALHLVEPDKNDGSCAVYLESVQQMLLSSAQRVHAFSVRVWHAWLVLYTRAYGTHLPTLYSLQLRTHMVLSMALTEACSALLGVLWLQGPGPLPASRVRALQRWPSAGALMIIASHMSCYGTERALLEDQIYAWQLVSTCVRFRLVRALTGLRTCTPLIDGHSTALRVCLPVPDRVFSELPANLQQSDGWFSVHCCMWNVGINHEAYFGQKLGENSVEIEANQKATATARRWLDTVKQAAADQDQDHMLMLTADAQLTKLEKQVAKQPSEKNVNVLEQACAFARAVDCPIVLGCKSGKDRTSMAITLQQCQLLTLTSGLSPTVDLPSVLDSMRTLSVRRTNCEKNIGQPKYSFSMFQMPFLPRNYRPPHGTFGQYST